MKPTFFSFFEIFYLHRKNNSETNIFHFSWFFPPRWKQQWNLHFSIFRDFSPHGENSSETFIFDFDFSPQIELSLVSKIGMDVVKLISH